METFTPSDISKWMSGTADDLLSKQILESLQENPDGEIGRLLKRLESKAKVMLSSESSDSAFRLSNEQSLVDNDLDEKNKFVKNSKNKEYLSNYNYGLLALAASVLLLTGSFLVVKLLELRFGESRPFIPASENELQPGTQSMKNWLEFAKNEKLSDGSFVVGFSSRFPSELVRIVNELEETERAKLRQSIEKRVQSTSDQK